MNNMTLEKKPIAISENQSKVIKDKYLKDEKTVEELFERVSRNIALSEIVFHPNAEKWGMLEDVKARITETNYDEERSNKTILFHEGVSEASDREKNFLKFLSNLENIYTNEKEAREIVDAKQAEFYNMMADFDFLPNSPTLMNAGRELQQLSACYVLPVPDSMEGIAKALTAQSFIQKSGGGTGFSFERLRPKGDKVRKTNGVASGALSFMKLFDQMTDVIKQGGTRRGANMGILPYWHPEIKDFITMKSKEKIMENFNISVAIDSKFMKAVETNSTYEIINPHSKKQVGTENAKEIFDMMVESAWTSGDPGIIFMDEINMTNPTPAIGKIESTNPCFAGGMRIATNKGLLTFEELYKEKTDIEVATDNRVPITSPTSEVGFEGGNVAVAVKTDIGITLRKAVPVFKTRKNWPVFTLKTQHGFEVTATADHKFFTPNGLKELQDLKPNDEILIQSGPGTWNKNYTLPPFIANNKLKARSKRGDAELPKKWSRELGELLGWVIGDGWVSEEMPKGRNIPNYTIGLMYGDEEKKILAPKFRALIKQWTGLKGSEIERNGTLTQYYKSALYYFLNSLGIHEKNGLNKQVPESIWKAPREAVLGFLSALFTADGTVNVSAHKASCSVRLANSSKTLLTQIQTLLLNEGIVSKLYLRRKAGKKMMPDSKRRPKLYDCAAQYELIIDGGSRDLFLSEIGFLISSKQKKAEAWLHAKQRKSNKDSFTDLVRSVESAGTTDVYCTTEKETHSVIANGFVTAQCGEQPLLPWESCNLGSINLSNFVTGELTSGELDYPRLEKTIQTAIRFLDNVIEINNYPLGEIEKIVKNNRKIGLGIMGWAETMVKMGIPYDSHQGIKKAEEIMEFINKKAMEYSCELAKERGIFPNWKNSIYDAGGKYYKGNSARPRNASRTTIAPTGTIAIAAGLQGSGIEPFFAIAYTRYNAKALDALKKGKAPDRKDTFFEVNSLFKEIAKKNYFFGLDEKILLEKVEKNHKAIKGITEIPKKIQDLFPTAHDISFENHIKIQGAFQKHVDNAVSKTINMPSTAKVDDVESCYMLAHKLGCKGLTVYRDGCKTQQVLNISSQSIKAKKKASYRSFGVSSEYFQIKTGYGPLHMHINFNEHGPYQIFTNIPPLGTEISGLTALIGILMSKYFEEGGEPLKVIKHLNSVKGDRPVGFGENRVNSIAHAISIGLRSHLKRTGWIDSDEKEDKLELWEVSRTSYCPKCYSSNVSYESGCSGPTCHDCGYSE
ncbi:MAG: hypothetical protein L6420_01310, partial [Elusimicrobia bacterium]|nr:hypothetical protein [Elusimicrobiota bacterium]